MNVKIYKKIGHENVSSHILYIVINLNVILIMKKIRFIEILLAKYKIYWNIFDKKSL